MSSDQVGGWVRATLASFVPWLVMHGVSEWFSTGILIPVVAALVIGLWSHFTNAPGTVLGK